MQTRSQILYSVYHPGGQASQREREHFDTIWNIQQQIPDTLSGPEFNWINSIWLSYGRMPNGGFRLIYTVFRNSGGYFTLFQNVMNPTLQDTITYLQKNLQT
jgi:hypothetical protein